MNSSIRSRISIPWLALLLSLASLAGCFVEPAKAGPVLAVRVKVVSVDGQPAGEQKFTLKLPGTEAPVQWASGDWSEWAHFARYNNERLLAVPCTVTPNPAPIAGKFPRLKLELETALDTGEKTPNQADLFGPRLQLTMWKEGDKVHADTRAGYTEQVYGPRFRAAAIPENERPKRIAFGDRFILGNWEDNNLLSWKEGADGLAGLGINALSPEGFGGQKLVVDTIRNAGISHVWNAVYNPPGYAFNFNLDRAEVFKTFVQKQMDPLIAAGWAKEDIAYWVTSDEPGWYYPARYNELNNDPNAMDAFRGYLKANGQTPKTLGLASWAKARLIGRREYKDLPSRRLFYWSNRFLPWASSKFFSEVTRAYEGAIRPGVPVMVNFNNFMGTFYNPGPVANNGDKANPNAAMGQHDWLEFGRLRGSTAIATEDWFGDATASYWSFYAARLRSAADLSGDPSVGIGGLIIPRASGEPGGMPRKIMALVGNGAKTVEFFVFGPESSFPGNCWSENTPVYKEIAAGTRLVGRAEELLYPGKLRRPEVAILTPQSSQLWDLEDQESARGLYDATNNKMHTARMEYTSEMMSLYHALQRSAIPVNFTDEQQLTEASLDNYKVLYVTAPDLPAESVAGLLRWVRAGGVLVTLPGAGQNDRYHQPVPTLNEATGIAPQTAMRELSNWGASVPNGTLTIGGATLTAYGRREPLRVTDAQVLHAFGDGTPAVTQKTLGAGRILHFTFLPGLSYYKATADRTIPDRLLAGGPTRDLVAGAVRLAGVKPPVTVNRAVVEAPALYSDKGVAVTLLNYETETTHAPPKQTRITVAVDRPVARVESAQRGKLNFTQQGNQVTVTVELADVDVLQFFYN